VRQVNAEYLDSNPAPFVYGSGSLNGPEGWMLSTE
jgi:hypothetical protein